MRRFLIPLALILCAGCSTDDPGATDGGGTCTCEPRTAAGTTYANSASGLASDDVQGALDELAARPVAEPPLRDRIEYVVREFPNPGTPTVDVIGSCPDQPHDLVLGGSCSAVSGGAVTATGIIAGETTAGYQCFWDQPAGTAETLRVTIVCLRDAR